MQPETLPKTSVEQAKLLAERLIGFYPMAAATDPRIFLTGVIELLTSYPPRIAERSISAINGLPARYKFFPSIAEIKETLDEWYAADVKHAQTVNRWNCAALPPPADDMPPLVNTTSPDALCRKHGLRGIPREWDAVDVALASVRYGASFPEVVDRILAGQMRAERFNGPVDPEIERGAFWDKFEDESESPVPSRITISPELRAVIGLPDDTENGEVA